MSRSTLPVRLRLTPDLNARLTAVAVALARPKSWVIEQAIQDYLSIQAAHLAAIEAGIQAADAGQVVAHDQVAAWVESWDGTDERAKPA